MTSFGKVLKIFKAAAKNVPAYATFLKQRKINSKKIRNPKDFLSVPVMEKKNYLYKFPLTSLFTKNQVPPMAYASSGSSGTPTFWFRDDSQETRGGLLHEQIFSKVFGIKKEETTLVVNCFSMGLWVAGNYTLSACRQVSRMGYRLTTVTPGVEKQDILSVLKKLAPKYKNLIIAGYPPFVMDMLLEARQRGIKFNKRTFILTAGDKFTEEWRFAACKIIKGSIYKSIVSIYGCADAAVLGFETPLSISIRQLCLKNKQLYKILFNDEAITPALVQYDPGTIYFEELNGELLFTTNTSIPLIRYNLHDLGKIISYQKMINLLRANGLLVKVRPHLQWNQPFIVKTGRTDVAVTFYALNIYPENIKAVIDVKIIKKYLTGNYSAFNKNTKDSKTQKLFVQFELKDKINPSRILIKKVTKVFVEKLSQNNIEYRKLYSTIGSKAIPHVQLVKFGKLRAESGSLQQTIGKKPKIIV